MSKPKKVLDRGDLVNIWRLATGKVCPDHDIQLAPVFDADYRVIDWQCWACEAGLSALTDEQRAANREAGERWRRKLDEVGDTAELDPYRAQ